MSISQNFPSTRPSLNLNFARSQKLDPRITFTRSSTATYTGGDGLIKTATTDTPRFDFNATTGECLGLLIEESRSNNVLYSQSFIDRWDASFISGTLDLIDIVGTDNTTTSPDGTTNAATLTNSLSGARATSVFGATIGTTKNSPLTFSCFLKANTTSTVNLEFVCNTNVSSYTYRSYATFTLTGSGSVSSVTNVAIDGSTPSGTASIQQYPNDWYKCIISFATYNGANSLNGTLSEIRPNSGSASGSIYAWGRQLEAGAFPTSYIPTVASTVTRSADSASITGANFSSWYNSTEGSILGVYDRLDNQLITSPSAKYPMIFLFGIYPDRIALADYGGTTGQQFNVFTSPGTLQTGLITNGGVVTPINTRLKSVGAYKTNDFASVGYSGSVQTDTSGTIPTVSLARLGNENATDNYLNGHISQLSYYPVRLSNSQLQSLTK